MSRLRIKKLKIKKGGNAKFITLILLSALFNINIFSQTTLVNAFPNLTFPAPVDIQHSGDGTNRLFIVGQTGIIYVVENNRSESDKKVFLDISDRVIMGGEKGLLGLTFHPDYENNGYFYVNYTAENPGLKTRISRFSVTSDPNAADPGSELILIEQDQPYENHNGGQVAFGSDGFLYIALGDGGSSGDPQNRAQNKQTILGKILRIDVNAISGNLSYGIPKDNPFVGNTDGFREEIFAYGLRNPWRFSFDNNTIWCADVGQSDWEEINIIESGKNYGWRLMEGNHCYNPPQNCDTISGLTRPIWEYSHFGGGFSVTGGYVYRGSEVPELSGKYIYGDYVSKKIWTLTYDFINPAVNEHLLDAPGYITSFGRDQNGEIYICLDTQDGGKIYKIAKVTGTDQGNSANPDDYYLSPVFPNPFNPSTSISFYLPEPGTIKLEIISTSGEVLKVLKNEQMMSGSHSIIWNAESLPSGIYFIRLLALSSYNSISYNKIIKAILLK